MTLSPGFLRAIASARSSHRADLLAVDRGDDVAAEADLAAVELRDDVAALDRRPSRAGLSGATVWTSTPWSTGRFRSRSDASIVAASMPR